MRKKQLLILLFLLFLTSGLILPNYHSALGNGAQHGKELLEPDLTGLDEWSTNVLVDSAKWFFSGLIAGVLGNLIIISGAFFKLSQTILNLVISPTFINISFTGSDNVFVTTGWGIIRGLTYIFIILGLIVIALATILRITSYQMKKTLPLLIIVALLINFTPMLCGLVIDASNIIMKDFLKGGLGTEKFFELINTQVENLWTKDDVSETFAKGVVFVGFNIVGGLILLLFAFLFLFRYVALWMLVILSPLALFCYIFPATKKMWDQWLNQFIQWCFIGIPAAFTLYLASIMIEVLIEGGAIEGVKGGAEILGYIVPLAFLVGGLLMSLQTGAMGADLAIKGFKWTGGETRKGVERGLKIPEKAEKLGRWAAGKPVLGIVGRPLISYAKRRRDEAQKELEGVPFKAQAAITGKSVRDIVRGLQPLEFAKKARPDDITLDVLMAMSPQQVKTTGTRGKPEVIQALHNLTIGLKNNLALQKEYLNLLSQGKNQEAIRYTQKVNSVSGQDPNYQP